MGWGDPPRWGSRVYGVEEFSWGREQSFLAVFLRDQQKGPLGVSPGN